MNQEARTKSVLIIIALSICTLAAVMFYPPIAQNPHYHEFADARPWFGIPNFGDVASNLFLFLPGLLGTFFMLKRSVRTPGTTFRTSAEWWPYLFFFVGATLIGVGSTYYHWQPGSERLVWDRLPMTIAFMAMFSAVIAERISPKAGTYLTLPLILLGVGTVFNWIMTERLGLGDLRLYGVIQFFPLLCMPVIFYCFPARYTHQPVLLGALGWYVAAKVFEALDQQVYHLTGVVSGHTIKHILSGLAIYWVLRCLQRRSPEYDLAELVAVITPRNRHEEIPTGPAVGRET